MFGLIPIDKIDISILKYLKHELKIIFDREIKTLPEVKIQKCAYNNLRGQYNARTILESDILNFKEETVDKILAVIDRDLYSPELNFVFGEVDRIGGRKAIISITRLREEFYNQAPDKNLFFKRVLKEAIHELGHLCGITHCGNPKCVMYFSNSLLSTDNKSENFCRVCQVVLKSKK